MKIIKNQSVETSMKLNETEKDILGRLEDDGHTEKCLIAFYLTALAKKPPNLKSFAIEWGIKAKWTNIAFEIGKKLWFKDIGKMKRMKRYTPVRLESIA